MCSLAPLTEDWEAPRTGSLSFFCPVQPLQQAGRPFLMEAAPGPLPQLTQRKPTEDTFYSKSKAVPAKTTLGRHPVSEVDQRLGCPI